MSYEHHRNPAEIKNLFANISNTYDLANDVITFGKAHSWRKKLVQWSEASRGNDVLDCASGTSDLALEFKKVVGEKGRVVSSDFCPEMLEIGKQKATKADLNIEFQVGDAMQLSFTDKEFDITSIAYGIRNVKDPLKAISEMARVTKSDGFVLILETGEISTPLIGSAIQVYFKYVVPRLGGWVSGQRQAYEYLNESSLSFPCREDFLAIMEKTKKFKKLEYKTLMGGASYIYKGTVS
ncbi:MAG: ubiquinone/menaquinone biosynthesis methyltransferase [Bdellovibrionaceae bacterium]|nr:ubiquinone/menaquinone biosynthesis methyltransferase [Pseudobdellovibrionaceae bacterium]